jgi:ribosomal protein S18 acetylase RimI-like enzyme
VKVLRAVPGDAGLVVDQIRAALPAPLLPLTIWQQPGVRYYVEQALAQRGSGSRAYYLLAEDDGETAGIVEFRRSGHEAVLNHVSIAPQWRGRSWGRVLLRESALDFLSSRAIETVLLDVDPANLLAYRWYRRLCFEPAGASYWHLAQLCAATETGSIVGLAEADAVHREFGFSQILVETKRHRHEVGRLGQEYFRLDESPWRDPGVHAALRHLDPKRSVLLLGSNPLDCLPVVHHLVRLRTTSVPLCLRLIHDGSVDEGSQSLEGFTGTAQRQVKHIG